jgi:hypothetical protein
MHDSTAFVILNKMTPILSVPFNLLCKTLFLEVADREVIRVSQEIFNID